MRPRIELLRLLLKEDWVIFIAIDDEEMAYLKVLCDEIFWRKNFVQTFMWLHWKGKKDKNSRTLQEYTLCDAKNKEVLEGWSVIENVKGTFSNPDGDKKGDWFSGSISFSEERSNKNGKNYFTISSPSGIKWTRQWQCSEKEMEQYLTNWKIYFWEAPEYKNVPRIKIYPDEVQEIIPPNILDNCWTTRSAKNEIQDIFWFPGFDTPKPEVLIQKIIEISSRPNDIILDSFLWSGTTSAVAHKMGRRYIGIEMGNHAYTLCKIRLDKVIEWRDQWGISRSADWKWGGGYKFYELAPSFITLDEFGNRIVDEFYNDSKLVRAMCKLMNYTFKPSQTEYFKQGVGTGHNYLFVTTQTLSIGLVRQIVSHLGINETLVICPKKYEAGAESVDPRITIKKIPQSILKACQYGKKDYLLPIRESTLEEIEDEEEEPN